MQKRPVRTCIGCGKKNNKSELLRFALGGDMIPVYDRTMVMEGRGVYCCRKESCVRSLSKRKTNLSRAFRQEIAGKVKIDLLLESGSFE